MKFLVLGASGMAGHVICIYLKEQGHDVVGFSRRGVKFVESIVGDASDFSLIKGIIKAGRFNAVINAVGILNQFAEEDKETATLLNAYLPHYLVKITADMETQIIHMSTDCVFSGHTGPYTEDALRDGETFYDRSKAIGELNDDKNLTLRNSIVGPDINKNGTQLIFNTHDTNLLKLNILRRDQIWFTEKDNYSGVSDLYPLSDFSVRKTENVEKGYMLGRYGAVPFIKNDFNLWEEE